MKKNNLNRNNDESGQILKDNFVNQFGPKTSGLSKEFRESVKQKSFPKAK